MTDDSDESKESLYVYYNSVITITAITEEIENSREAKYLVRKEDLAHTLCFENCQVPLFEFTKLKESLFIIRNIEEVSSINSDKMQDSIYNNITSNSENGGDEVNINNKRVNYNEPFILQHMISKKFITIEKQIIHGASVKTKLKLDSDNKRAANFCFKRIHEMRNYQEMLTFIQSFYISVFIKEKDSYYFINYSGGNEGGNNNLSMNLELNSENQNKTFEEPEYNLSIESKAKTKYTIVNQSWYIKEKDKLFSAQVFNIIFSKPDYLDENETKISEKEEQFMLGVSYCPSPTSTNSNNNNNDNDTDSNKNEDQLSSHSKEPEDTIIDTNQNQNTNNNIISKSHSNNSNSHNSKGEQIAEEKEEDYVYQVKAIPYKKDLYHHVLNNCFWVIEEEILLYKQILHKKPLNVGSKIRIKNILLGKYLKVTKKQKKKNNLASEFGYEGEEEFQFDLVTEEELIENSYFYHNFELFHYNLNEENDYLYSQGKYIIKSIFKENLFDKNDNFDFEEVNRYYQPVSLNFPNNSRNIIVKNENNFIFYISEVDVFDASRAIFIKRVIDDLNLKLKNAHQKFVKNVIEIVSTNIQFLINYLMNLENSFRDDNYPTNFPLKHRQSLLLSYGILETIKNIITYFVQIIQELESREKQEDFMEDNDFEEYEEDNNNNKALADVYFQNIDKTEVQTVLNYILKFLLFLTGNNNEEIRQQIFLDLDIILELCEKIYSEDSSSLLDFIIKIIGDSDSLQEYVTGGNLNLIQSIKDDKEKYEKFLRKDKENKLIRIDKILFYIETSRYYLYYYQRLLSLNKVKYKREQIKQKIKDHIKKVNSESKKKKNYKHFLSDTVKKIEKILNKIERYMVAPSIRGNTLKTLNRNDTNDSYNNIYSKTKLKEVKEEDEEEKIINNIHNIYSKSAKIKKKEGLFQNMNKRGGESNINKMLINEKTIKDVTGSGTNNLGINYCSEEGILLSNNNQDFKNIAEKIESTDNNRIKTDSLFIEEEKKNKNNNNNEPISFVKNKRTINEEKELAEEKNRVTFMEEEFRGEYDKLTIPQRIRIFLEFFKSFDLDSSLFIEEKFFAEIFSMNNINNKKIKNKINYIINGQTKFIKIMDDIIINPETGLGPLLPFKFFNMYFPKIDKEKEKRIIENNRDYKFNMEENDILTSTISNEDEQDEADDQDEEDYNEMVYRSNKNYPCNELFSSSAVNKTRYNNNINYGNGRQSRKIRSEIVPLMRRSQLGGQRINQKRDLALFRKSYLGMNNQNYNNLYESNNRNTFPMEKSLKLEEKIMKLDKYLCILYSTYQFCINQYFHSIYKIFKVISNYFVNYDNFSDIEENIGAQWPNLEKLPFYLGKIRRDLLSKIVFVNNYNLKALYEKAERNPTLLEGVFDQVHFFDNISSRNAKSGKASVIDDDDIYFEKETIEEKKDKKQKGTEKLKIKEYSEEDMILIRCLFIFCKIFDKINYVIDKINYFRKVKMMVQKYNYLGGGENIYNSSYLYPSNRITNSKIKNKNYNENLYYEFQQLISNLYRKKNDILSSYVSINNSKKIILNDYVKNKSERTRLLGYNIEKRSDFIIQLLTKCEVNKLFRKLIYLETSDNNSSYQERNMENIILNNLKQVQKIVEVIESELSVLKVNHEKQISNHHLLTNTVSNNKPTNEINTNPLYANNNNFINTNTNPLYVNNNYFNTYSNTNINNNIINTYSNSLYPNNNRFNTYSNTNNNMINTNINPLYGNNNNYNTYNNTNININTNTINSNNINPLYADKNQFNTYLHLENLNKYMVLITKDFINFFSIRTHINSEMPKINQMLIKENETFYKKIRFDKTIEKMIEGIDYYPDDSDFSMLKLKYCQELLRIFIEMQYSTSNFKEIISEHYDLYTSMIMKSIDSINNIGEKEEQNLLNICNYSCQSTMFIINNSKMNFTKMRPFLSQFFPKLYLLYEKLHNPRYLVIFQIIYSYYITRILLFINKEIFYDDLVYETFFRKIYPESIHERIISCINQILKEPPSDIISSESEMDEKDISQNDDIYEQIKENKDDEDSNLNINEEKEAASVQKIQEIKKRKSSKKNLEKELMRRRNKREEINKILQRNQLRQNALDEIYFNEDEKNRLCFYLNFLSIYILFLHDKNTLIKTKADINEEDDTNDVLEYDFKNLYQKIKALLENSNNNIPDENQNNQNKKTPLKVERKSLKLTNSLSTQIKNLQNDLLYKNYLQRGDFDFKRKSLTTPQKIINEENQIENNYKFESVLLESIIIFKQKAKKVNVEIPVKEYDSRNNGNEYNANESSFSMTTKEKMNLLKPKIPLIFYYYDNEYIDIILLEKIFNEINIQDNIVFYCSNITFEDEAFERLQNSDLLDQILLMQKEYNLITHYYTGEYNLLHDQYIDNDMKLFINSLTNSFTKKDFNTIDYMKNFLYKRMHEIYSEEVLIKDDEKRHHIMSFSEELQCIEKLELPNDLNIRNTDLHCFLNSLEYFYHRYDKKTSLYFFKIAFILLEQNCKNIGTKPKLGLVRGITISKPRFYPFNTTGVGYGNINNYNNDENNIDYDLLLDNILESLIKIFSRELNKEIIESEELFYVILNSVSTFLKTVKNRSGYLVKRIEVFQLLFQKFNFVFAHLTNDFKQIVEFIKATQNQKRTNESYQMENNLKSLIIFIAIFLGMNRECDKKLLSKNIIEFIQSIIGQIIKLILILLEIGNISSLQMADLLLNFFYYYIKGPDIENLKSLFQFNYFELVTYVVTRMDYYKLFLNNLSKYNIYAVIDNFAIVETKILKIFFVYFNVVYNDVKNIDEYRKIKIWYTKNYLNAKKKLKTLYFMHKFEMENRDFNMDKSLLYKNRDNKNDEYTQEELFQRNGVIGVKAKNDIFFEDTIHLDTNIINSNFQKNNYYYLDDELDTDEIHDKQNSHCFIKFDLIIIYYTLNLYYKDIINEEYIETESLKDNLLMRIFKFFKQLFLFIISIFMSVYDVFQYFYQKVREKKRHKVDLLQELCNLDIDYLSVTDKEMFSYLNSKIKCVEITIECILFKVYFPLTNKAKIIEENTDEYLVVESQNLENYVPYLIGNYDNIHIMVTQNYKFDKFANIPVIKLMFKNINLFGIVLMILGILTNLLILLSYSNFNDDVVDAECDQYNEEDKRRLYCPRFLFKRENDYHKVYTALKILGGVQFLLQAMTFADYLIRRFSINWMISKNDYLVKKAKESLNKQDISIGCCQYVIHVLPRIIKNLCNYQTVYYLLSLLFLLLGYFKHPFFYGFTLLEIVNRVDVMLTVLKAMYEPGKDLLILLLMVIMLMYFFSLLAVSAFISHFPNQKDSKNFLNTFMRMLDQTFKQDGGIGTYLQQELEPGYEPYIWKAYCGWRFWFDFIFFIIILSLVLPMFLSIILNYYSSLREKTENFRKRKEKECLVCELNREFIEKINNNVKQAFEKHVFHNHNVKNYINYLIYVQSLYYKDPIIEESVWDLHLNNLNSFLPKNVCFRLKEQKIFEYYNGKAEDNEMDEVIEV